MCQEQSSNIHEGHRKRFKERFLKYGIGSFQPHEVFELLLFFSIPRHNTNEIGHRLINRFGSLNGVLSASYEELIQVDGIKENSAILIRLFSEVIRQSALESSELPHGLRYNNIKQVGEYLVSLYKNINIERIYMLMFDNSMRLIDCIHIIDGTVNSSNVSANVLVRHAILRNASSIILSHNHPNGLGGHSKADIAYTFNLKSSLEDVGINLLEHIAVSSNQYYPIFQSYSYETEGINAITTQVKDSKGLQNFNYFSYDV